MLFILKKEAIPSIAPYIKKLDLKKPPNSNITTINISNLLKALPTCIVLKVCRRGNKEVAANFTPRVDINIMQLIERINPSNIVAIIKDFLTFLGSVTDE